MSQILRWENSDSVDGVYQSHWCFTDLHWLGIEPYIPMLWILINTICSILVIVSLALNGNDKGSGQWNGKLDNVSLCV